MKKKIFVLLFSLLPLLGTAQNLSVSSSINDSVAPGQYHYFIEGSMILDSGMELFIELLDSSQSNVIFSGHFSFDSPEESSLPEFGYDAMEKHYKLDLGIYDSEQYVLKMWTTKNDTIINELMVQK